MGELTVHTGSSPITMKLLSPHQNQYGDNHLIQTQHFLGSTASTFQGVESPAWSSVTGNTDRATLMERIMTDPDALAFIKEKLNKVPTQTGKGKGRRT